MTIQNSDGMKLTFTCGESVQEHNTECCYVYMSVTYQVVSLLGEHSRSLQHHQCSELLANDLDLNNRTAQDFLQQTAYQSNCLYCIPYSDVFTHKYCKALLSV